MWACMRLQALMASKVQPQLVLSVEHLLTELAFKRLFSRVGASVTIEVLVVISAIITALVSALKFPLRTG